MSTYLPVTVDKASNKARSSIAAALDSELIGSTRIADGRSVLLVKIVIGFLVVWVYNINGIRGACWLSNGRSGEDGEDSNGELHGEEWSSSVSWTGWEVAVGCYCNLLGSAMVFLRVGKIVLEEGRRSYLCLSWTIPCHCYGEAYLVTRWITRVDWVCIGRIPYQCWRI